MSTPGASSFSFSSSSSSSSPSSFSPFQFKEPQQKSDEEFLKIFDKFCPVVFFGDGYVPVGVESFLGEAELKRKETKVISLLTEERQNHVLLPQGSCSFEKMRDVKINNTGILREEYESKTQISSVFLDSKAIGSTKSPIYVSILKPQDEEEGIPKPAPFVDLLYCFLLSPPEAYWECVIVRTDNNFANILGICLNSQNLSHPLRGWFFPPRHSFPSPSSPPFFFEMKKGTSRPLLTFGRGGRKGANAFLSPRNVGDEGKKDLLWDPSFQIITEKDPIVLYKGRWSETNKDCQQLQKIFSSRVYGGPSPLRVITCPVKWEEKKDSTGVFYSGSSSLASDVMFGKRVSHFFSVNNGVNDVVWSLYDHQKKNKNEIKFSVMGMDGGCFMKDVQSGVKTTGFFSPKPNSFLYLNRMQTREKPAKEIEFLYVCVTETDFNETDISAPMIVPRQVQTPSNKKTPKKFNIIWDADPSLVLDLRNGTNAKDVVVLKTKKEGRLSQLWEFRECSADWSRRSHLVNVGSGMVLDIRGGAKSGAILQQYPAKTSSVDNQMVTYNPQKKKLYISSYVVALAEGEKEKEKVELLEGEEKGVPLTTQRDSSSLKTKTFFSLQSVNETLLNEKKSDIEPPFLDVVVTKNAEKIFDDENTGAVPVSFSLFNPIPPPGFYRLGTYGEQGHSPVMSEYTTLIRRKKDTDFIPFTDPIDYKLVWSTQGTWAKRSVWVWEMIPPKGFVAFGVACTTTKSPPGINTYKVVHESMCHWATANFTENHLNLGFPLWADQRTGSKLSITFWKTSPSFHPSFPLSYPSFSPREVTSSSLSLPFPVRSRSFPSLVLFPELLFSSFLRLEKSRLDGYTEVSAYNPRNFAGIHSAIRTICDIKFKKEGEEKQRDEYSWGEEEKEEEEEGGEEGEERWGEEEGLEGRKVLGVVHEDEGEILRMVKNWMVHSQITIGRQVPAQQRRDFTLEGETYVPLYQFEVVATVKKDWKEIEGKDEKSAHFLSEKVEVVEFACADESQMNLFAEMKSHSLFPPSPPPPPPTDLSKPPPPSPPIPPPSKEEKEREEVRKAEEKRYDFYIENSDGEVVDGFGFLCGWKEAWKKVESSAIKKIMEKSQNFADPKTYLSDVRCLVKIQSLRITLFYYPLLSCSFLWGENRVSVWVDGLSEIVFTTNPTAMQKRDLKERKEKEKEERPPPCFLSGSKLMSLDDCMSYNPYRTYLILPPPSSMGHFGLWNRGPSPIVVQAIFRNNAKTVGTPALIPPGQKLFARYQSSNKEITVCVMSGDSSHLHLIQADPSSYSKSQHLNLLNASTS